MNNYLTSYQKRLIKNDFALKQLAIDVMEADPSVTVYLNNDKDRPNYFIVFFREEEMSSITFKEVPYRWDGCGVKDHPGKGNNADMPFEVEHVLSSFKPITSVLNRKPNEYFKSKDHYLSIYSSLKQYKPIVGNSRSIMNIEQIKDMY